MPWRSCGNSPDRSHRLSRSASPARTSSKQVSSRCPGSGFAQGQAAARIRRIVRSCSDRLKVDLVVPTVLTGDLGQPDLGLTAADRSWLALNCRSVIHSAASLSFQETAAGEPWRTNVAGTETLLQLCGTLGIVDFHYISTAFVCGKNTGLVTEDALANVPEFHNVYEESKFQAEPLVRRSPGLPQPSTAPQ